MDARTAFVWDSWNAVRWHCDRTVGTKPFAEMSRRTSSRSWSSLALNGVAASAGSKVPSSSLATCSGAIAKRSLTDSSPVHESRCVFRSTWAAQE